MNDKTYEAKSVTNFRIGIDYFSSDKLIISAPFNLMERRKNNHYVFFIFC